MTSIANLPPLETLTNDLIFPVVDLSDGVGRTKHMTIDQIKTLSVGPRGAMGPAGPSGPTGPAADQSLNTSSTVVFEHVSVTAGITFGDGSTQNSTVSVPVQILNFSLGNIYLSKTQITGKILSANPTSDGLTLFLPSSQTMNGIQLIVSNNSTSYTFEIQGGTVPIISLNPATAAHIVSDGFGWFVV